MAADIAPTIRLSYCCPMDTPVSAALASPTETGALGICRLKRFWSRSRAARQGVPAPASAEERQLDMLVIDAVGLGIEQTAEYLGKVDPDFAAFERWIVQTTGGVDPLRVARFNALVLGKERPAEVARWLAAIDAADPVLSPDDLAFWNEHGYVVLHDAVPEASRDAAARAVFDNLEADPADPETWYCRRRHGIMVQYFQHPAFEANRRSPRIHKAFAQLWGTSDLWVTTDRVGFNAPERAGAKFPGPDLHWDVSLKTPIPLGTQGILYLTDTPPEQGAFTLVPGFHHRVDQWLASLPPGADPRRQDLHALGSRPIGGRAGDLTIWHHALPHGSRPNRGEHPRVVQYIAMYPAWREVQDIWI